MTVKLNELQRVLLVSASQHDDRSLDTAKHEAIDAAKLETAIAALVRRKLLTTDAGAGPDNASTYSITDAGLSAIGIAEADEVLLPIPTPADAPVASPTKTAMVLDLLKRPEGATLDQMVAATGWLPHTTRAALTGLRKRGHAVARTKTDDGSLYRIGGTA